MFGGERSKWSAVVVVVALVGSLVAVATGVSTAGAAPGSCTHTWIAGSGDYREKDNWSPAEVPDPDHWGCLPAGDYTVTVGPGGYLETGLLTIGASGGGSQPRLLVSSASLAVGNTGNWGTIELSSHLADDGATFSVGNYNGTIPPVEVLANHGLFLFSPGVGGTMQLSGGNVENSGTFRCATNCRVGAVSPRVVTSTGTVDVTTGSSLDFDSTNGGTNLILESGSVTNSGNIEHAGNRLELDGVSLTGNPIRNEGGKVAFTGSTTGTVRMVSGTNAASGTIPASLTVEVYPEDAATPVLSTDGSTLVNQGTLRLGGPGSGGATLRTDPGDAIDNAGTLELVAGGGGSRRIDGGLTNTGSMDVTSTLGLLWKGTFTNQGSLHVGVGAALTALGTNGGVRMEMVGGSVNNEGGIAHPGNTLQLGATTLTGNPIRNQGGKVVFSGATSGTVRMVSGINAASGTIPASLTVEVYPEDAASPILSTDGSTLVNQGTLRLGGPGSGGATLRTKPGDAIDNAGTLELLAGGGGSRLIDGGLTNTGSMDVTSASGELWKDTFTNQGSLHVGPGAALAARSTNGGVTTNFDSGQVDVDAGGTARFPKGIDQDGGATTVDGALEANLNLDGGSLGGTGTVTGNVTNNGAVVATGSSPGTLSVVGDFTQGPGGRLLAEVDGTAPGTYDHLSVSGTATLGGTVEVRATAVPSPGIDIVTAGGVTGDFATVEDVPEDWVTVGATAVTVEALQSFSDVGLAHPFFLDVAWLVAAGVTSGYSDGTFRPASPVTRMAMAAFLYRFSGSPPFTPPVTPSFSDVPASHPFFFEIEWLASTGITTGYPDGTFRPSARITRQAMAAFLYRHAGEPPFTPPVTPSFSDVPASHPFYTEIEWLASTGVAAGYADGSFRPTVKVTRQATAAFLHRYAATHE